MYLIIIMLVGWVFFYHTDLSEAFRFIGVMFGNAASFTNSEVSLVFRSNAVFMVMAAIASTPIIKKLFEAVRNYTRSVMGMEKFMDGVLKPVVNIAILVVSIIFLVGQSYNPFLYFRF